MAGFKGSWDWRPAQVVKQLVKLEGTKRGDSSMFELDDEAAQILTGDKYSKDIIDASDKYVDKQLFGEQKKLDKAEAERVKRSAAERGTMQGYWENYQTWGEDARTKFERTTGSVKATMAASGIKAGSEQWDTNVANVATDYENELAGFKKGVTGAALTQWATDAQTGADEQLGMEDLLAREFGTKDFAPDHGTTKSGRATDRAQRAAAGSTTASPWW